MEYTDESDSNPGFCEEICLLKVCKIDLSLCKYSFVGFTWMYYAFRSDQKSCCLYFWSKSYTTFLSLHITGKKEPLSLQDI